MAISKVEFAGEVLIDLTGDTVSAETTLAGFNGHGADGEPFSGSVDLSVYATTAYVDGQVDAIESSISTLSQTVSTQGESITSLQSTTTTQGQSISSLQSEFGTLNQTVTTQGQNISALQGNVSTINSELSGKATTSYVNTELAKKQNKVSYSTSDLTAGSSALASGEIYFVYE